MRKYEEISSTIKILKSVTCDICNTQYDIRDYYEIQEFTNINFVGGYGSVFGDGEHYTCDICQHCLKKLFGKYLKRIENVHMEL